MSKKVNFKDILLIFIIVIIVLCVLYLPKILKKPDNDGLRSSRDSSFITKDEYDVNEYIPVYVDDEQMSRKYLKDFVNITLNDINSSFKLLDSEYRESVFGGLSQYKNFINTLDLSISTDIDKYAVYEKQGFKYYDVYDKNGKRFIFKTKGVMQYTVLFEDFNQK